MAFRTPRLCLTVVFCLCLSPGTFAFSLLGPFAPWMTPDVGFIHDEAWDIGGPRNLGDEFRWNVPVLTYGFDDNFKNFFGQPGIDAVEKAVAMLNAIPPASQIDLSTARLAGKRFHPTAQSMDVLDLKSFALVYLLEQIGLANPTRFVWNTTATNIPARATEEEGPYDVIIQRNFDPVNFEPTRYVNTIRFTYFIYDASEFAPYLFPEGNRIAIEIAIDQIESPFAESAVAAALPNLSTVGPRAGEYFTVLTRDDLGAVKYLLDTNNINVEPVLTSVFASDGSANFVHVAARPGVDKIMFQRFDPGSHSITNFFVDAYFDNGARKTQSLRRVIETPDIMFTAANHQRQFREVAAVRRTNPNYSHANSTGPGILQPETIISFHKFGDIYREPMYEDPIEGYIVDPRWSSFDSRTITPSPIFPVGPSYEGGRTLSVRTIQAEGGVAVEWKLRLIAGVQYAVETSSDFKNWTSVTNITAAPVHTLTNAVPSDSVFWRARRISGQ
jgi:hypothetical protein